MADQQAAVKQLWPSIGAYCTRYALTRQRLISGKDGIPIAGWKLANRRGELLLTRYQVAEKVGTSYDLICKFENGARNPTPAFLALLVQVLECDPSDLFLEST